ncbi:DUF2243 domain-containing protein [Pseudoduganella umbonata]|uniref:DUF2243 domain-containing protein n=1 Tax=Pseudoduganella umbonata TaxID=864828 RepID=A0A4P8HW02_9BURK|nr:DUF2243 domain-containing protein [Pseudoduganella umbonata]MBB3221913.1 putative membrane protein [Pseudoduganella umbonata]QCP14289.1 DUF2243 domain-containing protein [Pseudoduganella umbonata]
MLKSPWMKWSVVLGVALGGFFDGILLHQVLQWHHLLSLVPGMDDLRLQVMWDGYFHVLMYAIALAGLWGMWRAHRRGIAAPGATALAGAVLLGFGAWNLFDIGLAHWLLQIHRVRLDTPDPLLWDLLWLAAFGLLPLALGWWLRGRPSLPGSAAAALLVFGIGTALAGGWALREPPGQGFTAVVFAPGTTPAQVFDALDASDARLVWTDRPMGVVLVAVPKEKRWRFYRHGAVLVSGTGVPAGCIGWSKV